MSATATVILDSVNQGGVRLVTMQLRYWRGIHAEFLTHRMLSRNASSSRAIPVKKMLEQVRLAPAMPARFGGNKPGMQDTGEEHDGKVRLNGSAYSDVSVRDAWVFAANNAASVAEAMMEAGYHKQVCNRLLEPFQFISVIVTATEWSNFFALRDHAAADPSIQDLAHVMREAMNGSQPTELPRAGWHLPYIHEDEMDMPKDVLLELSTARCARVSYLTHEGKAPDVESDRLLYTRLVGADPKHMSPTEHQAFAMPIDGMESNLKGWTQYRKFVELGLSLVPPTTAKPKG